MEKRTLKHNDCKHFVAVDVVKGICRRSDKIIFIDSDICPKFEAVAKCKNCENFLEPDEDNIGTCKCSKIGYWTYGENFALNCEGYQAK